MRLKKTHAEPIQHVTDGERRGFLYRWNTGEVQVMWISEEASGEAHQVSDEKPSRDSNIVADL